MKPLALVPLLACLGLASCAVTPPTTPTSAAGPGAAAGTVSCSYRPATAPVRPVDPPDGVGVPATGTVVVTLQLGGKPLRFELDRAKAPCTVNSFESLARQGWFTNTTCHRLATRGIFMLQCGDPSGSGRGGPGYNFDDELAGTTSYPAGTLAMANSGPDTNGAQFFLVYADSTLSPRYTVFGTMDAASTQVVADLAFQGHDASYSDGTGRPNGPATITGVALG